MIAEDSEIFQKVFQMVEGGIVHGYDAFRYEVEVGEGYMETELTVEKDGIETTHVEIDFDISDVYFLVEEANINAARRGEPWKSFVLSYREGEQVNMKFNY
ncbi:MULTISPECIES: hypothetical protein [unclassified Pseudomonas]|uniref:hypothetical protein n=1 Tax=unclassified Pseudomonas TaxID=196821 RepID=UPI000A1F6C67|nr:MULTISPECIES: hypothetical protein [unclassified Pseudomonas]